MNNKEAIKWLNKNRPCISMTCNKENADNINIATDMAIKALEERPQGRWISTFTSYAAYECSCCGLTSPEAYDFCPNCGADMRGGRQ